MQAIFENKRNRLCEQLETNALESELSCYFEHGFCRDILLIDTNLNYLASDVFNETDPWNAKAIGQVCNQ